MNLPLSAIVRWVGNLALRRGEEKGGPELKGLGGGRRGSISEVWEDANGDRVELRPSPFPSLG